MFSFLKKLLGSFSQAAKSSQVKKVPRDLTAADTLCDEADQIVSHAIGETWRQEQALIYPKEGASPEELRTLGQRLQEWKEFYPGVDTIVGLEALLDGKYPSQWLGGGPVTRAELESNSLCAAVVKGEVDANESVESLRHNLPESLIRTICCTMPWN